MAFGNYRINFGGRTETIEQIMGKEPISPQDMTKKIWEFVKKNNLSTK